MGKHTLHKQDGVSVMGPAMRALTEKQRAFVLALRDVPNIKGRATEAARRAGFTDGPGLKVTAHRLMHDEKIQAAVKEIALGMMSSEGIHLTATLLDIAYGEIPATATERMKAVGMIFNRIGMPEVSEHKVKVEHSFNNDEQLKQLYSFARVLNMDPKALLGSMGMELVNGEVIDAEFAEVDRLRIEDQSDSLPTDDPFAWNDDAADQ